MAPILVSMLFLIPHWWKFEKDWKARLITLPFVILQFYPQMKAIEMLYLGLWKKDKSWKLKKDILAKEIGCLGTPMYNFHMGSMGENILNSSCFVSAIIIYLQNPLLKVYHKHIY